MPRGKAADTNVANIVLDQKIIQSAMLSSLITEKINYKSIVPNEYNKYTMDKIEELADAIETFGLMQPLVVKPVGDGKFLLISGHRRYEAIKILIEKRQLSQFNEINCVITKDDENDTVTNLKLHISNILNRELSEFDKMIAIADLRELNKAAISEGIVLKGRMREIISTQVGLGGTQVANYLKVADEADNELKLALKNKVMTLTEVLDAINNPRPKAEAAGGGTVTVPEGADGAGSAVNVLNQVKDKNNIGRPRQFVETVKVPQNKLAKLEEAWDMFKAACYEIDSQVFYSLVSKFEKKFDKHLKFMEGIDE